MDEDIQKQVAKVKELLDMGFITEEEFNRRMADLGVSADAATHPPQVPVPAEPVYIRPPSPGIQLAPSIEPISQPEPQIPRIAPPPPPPQQTYKKPSAPARPLTQIPKPPSRAAYQCLPFVDETRVSEDYPSVPPEHRMGYSLFKSAPLRPLELKPAADVPLSVRDADVKDHSKSMEAVPERCFAMVRAAASAARPQPPTCPQGGWTLATAPLIYGLQPNGVVVHCRQYVYYQTGLMTGKVTLGDILQQFKMTEGELVQCGTNPLVRVYDPALEIPHGYYELRPLRHRIHRFPWCDFSINRADYSSSFHCQYLRNAGIKPYSLAPGQTTAAPKVQSSFKVNPGLQFAILLRHLQQKYQVKSAMSHLHLLAMETPYNHRTRSLHGLITDCSRTRTCFICAAPAHFSCAFVCDAHFDQRIEDLHAAAIAGGKSLESALRDVSSSAEREGAAAPVDEYAPMKAYPPDAAKFCYVADEDLQSLRDAVALRATPEHQ